MCAQVIPGMSLVVTLHGRDRHEPLGSCQAKKNGVCLNCQGCTKNGAPYILWPGPPTEGRAISALLAAGTEPATLLAYRCWVVGWAAPVTRMALTGLGWGVAPGQKSWLVFYHWELARFS